MYCNPVCVFYLVYLEENPFIILVRVMLAWQQTIIYSTFVSKLCFFYVCLLPTVKLFALSPHVCPSVWTYCVLSCCPINTSALKPCVSQYFITDATDHCSPNHSAGWTSLQSRRNVFSHLKLVTTVLAPVITFRDLYLLCMHLLNGISCKLHSNKSLHFPRR